MFLKEYFEKVTFEKSAVNNKKMKDTQHAKSQLL